MKPDSHIAIAPTPSSVAPIITTALTAITPVIWGSTYLVTTEWLPPDRPLTAAFIRTLPAGLILIAFRPTPISRSSWLPLLILSILNIGLFQALLFVAAYRLPGGIAAVVGATQPLMVMGFTFAIDRIRPQSTAIATAVIAILGMSLIFLSAEARWDPIGLAAATAGTLCLGLGAVLSRRWQRSLPLLPFTGWQLLIGGLFLLPAALITEPPIETLQIENIFGYTYLSLIGALLAYCLWFNGLAQLPTSSVSSLGLFSPLTALFLGYAFLDESLTVRQFTGMIIVLGTVLALQRFTSSSKPATSIQKAL